MKRLIKGCLTMAIDISCQSLAGIAWLAPFSEPFCGLAYCWLDYFRMVINNDLQPWS